MRKHHLRWGDVLHILILATAVTASVVLANGSWNGQLEIVPEQGISYSGKHLFILSGQSNMSGLDPAISFTPTVGKAFGARNVIVIKDAAGGQPIRRWYKGWANLEGVASTQTVQSGDLYDRLMAKVFKAIDGQHLASVSFVWMQGESDAKEGNGPFYKTSLGGLLRQLKTDLGREDLHVVIGRLSDFDMGNSRFAHWTMVRNIQVEFAESLRSGTWVNSDDLNDGLNRNGKEIYNDLHMSVDGYRILGRRFAESAIRLIRDSFIREQ